MITNPFHNMDVTSCNVKAFMIVQKLFPAGFQVEGFGSDQALSGENIQVTETRRGIDGKMSAGKKYRGKMEKVVLEYVKDMEAELLQARTERVFITHSGCDDEVLNDVYRYLESLNIFKEILITRAGSVISSHCGPGTLGVLYIARD